MLQNVIYVRTLERACQLVGEEQLSEFLGLSKVQIRALRNQALPVPHDIFLKLVDVLLDREVVQAKCTEAQRATSDR
jgi:hypothetical protein